MGNVSKIQMGFQRSKNGIRVTVYAAEEVEQFFKNLSETDPPEVEPLELFSGRLWRPEGSDPLMVYSMGGNREMRGLQTTQNGVMYYLDRPNQRLLIENAANLSFLRIAGISSGNGLSFIYHGVVSEDNLNQYVDHMRKAAAAFYSNYLKPFNTSVVISTKQEG